MAITTLDGALAGMQAPEPFHKIGTTAEAAGIEHSHFYAAGRPGAAVAPTPGLAGAALTTYLGQLPFANPSSGNTYLARFASNCTGACSIRLHDRLWHNSGIVITTTTAQTVNSVTWPARDRGGATNGDGIMVALEVSATLGNGAVTNTTMSYTNQAGTASRTATIASFPATGVLGTFIPFQLQAGDSGVRSIQSLTLGTSYVFGTMHLVAYRPLSMLNILLANSGLSVDALTGGFVRMYNDTVPFLTVIASSASVFTVAGELIVTQG